MPVQETSALVLTLVAGGFTILGVVAKIAYDSVAARLDRQSQGHDRFADDRRKAYDAFFMSVKRQRLYNESLRQLVDRARVGETEMSDEERKAFPRRRCLRLPLDWSRFAVSHVAIPSSHRPKP